LRNLCNNPCSNGSVFSDSGAKTISLNAFTPSFLLESKEGKIVTNKRRRSEECGWMGGWGDLSVEARLQGLLTWDSGKQELKIISMRD
jgi:hypothetical protein